MHTHDALRQRISANQFDPARTLSRDEVRELVALASEAPSAFNLQHWRFVAVMDPAQKQRLQAVAHGQRKVADAAVTFVVLGDLRAHESLEATLQPSVAAGIVAPELAAKWVRGAARSYAADPRFARDEAIRSAAMAALALMLAAQARGLASGPMIGFDPDGVRRELGIPERYVPVMLLAVGFAAPGNLPRKPRLPADAVLAFDRWPPHAG